MRGSGRAVRWRRISYTAAANGDTIASLIGSRIAGRRGSRSGHDERWSSDCARRPLQPRHQAALHAFANVVLAQVDLPDGPRKIDVLDRELQLTVEATVQADLRDVRQADLVALLDRY